MIVDRKRMAAITESPVKAGVHSAKGAESEGISRFLGGLQNDFGIRD